MSGLMKVNACQIFTWLILFLHVSLDHVRDFFYEADVSVGGALQKQIKRERLRPGF
jgi:hypothetical protein